MEDAPRMWPPPDEHTMLEDDFGGSRSVRKRKVWRNKDKSVINCLRNTDTAERIEANLRLTHGSFKKGRKEERRKENT